MNRNLKKIISIIFAVGVFNIVTPTTNLNLMTTKAYADQITNLEMKDSDGDKVYLYNNSDCKSNHKIDDDELESGKTYYARTSLDDVKVSVSGVDSDHVRVFKGNSLDEKGEKIGSHIDLSYSTTTIVVRVYNDDLGDVEYSDGSYINQYTIRVKYTGEDDREDDGLDNVYLENITLSAGEINFAKTTYAYDVNVPEDCSKITIRARPNCDSDKYDNYKVKINGTKVDRDDKFKDDVSLSKGKNVIEIKVDDDEDNERIYTLNIIRGASTSSNVSGNDNNRESNKNSNGVTDIKINQWIQVDGVWKYNDENGNIVKNRWIQNYYVKEDGAMAIGWLSSNTKWYFLGLDGAKKTGWQWINGKWYYLDSQGVMQIGWIQDISGKYYYLNSDGSMAYNTTAGMYTLGADGAWSGN